MINYSLVDKFTQPNALRTSDDFFSRNSCFVAWTVRACRAIVMVEVEGP